MKLEMKNLEQSVYETIYKDTTNYKKYGHGFHGKGFVNYFVGMGFNNILDVGCGHNEFIKALRTEGVGTVWGIDFACPGSDQLADILNLPFEDKEWEWVTAWDVMEHLQPDQIDTALKELSRVSKYFSFTISYSESEIKLDDRGLHPTVWPVQEWQNRIEQYATLLNDPLVPSLKEGFWMGEWK
tara:strand:- start:313 stop:864 length:552 start_codon:yes stop_codon:yes gene_type:complete